MLRWFDGRILSADSFCYIQNFLVVTRVRPEKENLEKNDDLLSDEEVVLHNSSFLDTIFTRDTSDTEKKKTSIFSYN